MLPYKEMILAVSEKVRAMIAQGKSRAGGAGREGDRAYDAKTAGGTDESAERFVSAVYQELKGGAK